MHAYVFESETQLKKRKLEKKNEAEQAGVVGEFAGASKADDGNEVSSP